MGKRRYQNKQAMMGFYILALIFGLAVTAYAIVSMMQAYRDKGYDDARAQFNKYLTESGYIVGYEPHINPVTNRPILPDMETKTLFTFQDDSIN